MTAGVVWGKSTIELILHNAKVSGVLNVRWSDLLCDFLSF
jgi:hypothetical protein